MQTAGVIVQRSQAQEAISVNIDVVGVGAGVYDRCKELKVPAQAVNMGERAKDPEKFINLRAEAARVLQKMGTNPRRDVEIAPDAPPTVDIGNGETEGLYEFLGKSLATMTNTSNFVLPQGVKINYGGNPANVGDVFGWMITYCDTSIYRGLLLPGLVAKENGAVGGSRALGDTHFDLYMLVMKRLRRRVINTLLDQLVRTFIMWNFGPQENWMDRWTERFGPEYYGDLTQDVVGTLKRALGEGLSTKATMDQLEHVLTGQAYNKNRLEIIARTNATTAFNQGRLEMFNQAADFVPYVEFLAILDSRTTDICEARNGKIFRIGSADVASNTPPLHYRCRSVLSPVTQYDLEDMQKAGWKDPDGNTLQQKMDLSGMPELPKGFGSVGRNVPVQSEKVVTEVPKSAIIKKRLINVEIDELTPCLRNRKTNEIVDTEYNQITKQSDVKRISKEQNWDFNWEKQWKAKESNSEFYALTIKGENATQGIIEVRTHQGAAELRLMENAPPNRGSEGVYKGVGGHLAAIAVKRSFETGGKGYTFLDAKTVLIEHYKKELGAKVLSGTRMFIDESAAKNLYEKYFGGVQI